MKNQKVLIVEDELLIANDIRTILERRGYFVKIGCRSSNDAIRILKQEKFDLVLIDVFLSLGTKGIDVGNYLLNNSNIPYIYITATKDNLYLDEIKESRPYGIIFKPFNLNEIPVHVSIVLNNHQHISIDVLRYGIVDNLEEIPFVLKSVIEYIKNNISEKIEIQKLVRMTPWTYDYFIKVFSKYMNKTPYQYVLQKKIEKAKALIVESKYPITEIAVILSFESYCNFVNAFKREVNCTPIYFRKLNKVRERIDSISINN